MAVFAKTKITFNLVKVLYKQGRLPSVFWAVLLFVGLYVLSPIDLIPDPLVVVGWLDDIAVLYAGYRYITSLIEKRAKPTDKTKANAITIHP